MQFYCTFWDVLAADLAIIWAEPLGSMVLLLSCRWAVLSLLLEKRDLQALRSWHSLLLLRYKVMV